MTSIGMPAVAGRSHRALGASLWIAQSILTLMFVMAGVLKTTTPLDRLAGMLPWTADVPGGLVRFIGVAEFAGALGLILPALLRVAPWLTALASFGLTVVMLLAAAFHLSRGESAAIGMPIALGALAAFVAWGRWRAAPIRPR